MSDFDASDFERPARDRFAEWSRRARTCYRAAGAIDTTIVNVAEAADELERDSEGDDAAKRAVDALRLVQLTMTKARAELAAALRAKTMTPDNRKPEFWKAGK